MQEKYSLVAHVHNEDDESLRDARLRVRLMDTSEPPQALQSGAKSLWGSISLADSLPFSPLLPLPLLLSFFHLYVVWEGVVFLAGAESQGSEVVIPIGDIKVRRVNVLIYCIFTDCRLIRTKTKKITCLFPPTHFPRFTHALSLALRLFSLFLFTFFANQAKSEVFYPFVLSFSSPVICSLQLHVEYHSGVALEAAHAKVRQEEEEEEEEEEEKEEERTLENTISVSYPSPLLSFFKINSNMSCSSLPPLSLYS